MKKWNSIFPWVLQKPESFAEEDYDYDLYSRRL